MNPDEDEIPDEPLSGFPGDGIDECDGLTPVPPKPLTEAEIERHRVCANQIVEMWERGEMLGPNHRLMFSMAAEHLPDEEAEALRERIRKARKQ